jgi:hypothetical protein
MNTTNEFIQHDPIYLKYNNNIITILGCLFYSLLNLFNIDISVIINSRTTLWIINFIFLISAIFGF